MASQADPRDAAAGDEHRNGVVTIHPKVRLPLWAAVAVVIAAFARRTLLRGFSFDRTDALVLGLFVLVLVVTAIVRQWVAEEATEGHDASREEEHRSTPGDETGHQDEASGGSDDEHGPDDTGGLGGRDDSGGSAS